MEAVLQSEWKGHEEPQIELRRSYVKLPRGRIHAVPGHDLQYNSSGEPEVGVAYVRGRDSHLVGAGTVPFLRTEETTKPGANQTLGPSSRHVGSKLYQNEWVFCIPESPRRFDGALERAVDRDGATVYIDAARRDLKVKLAAAKIEDARRDLAQREQDAAPAEDGTQASRPHHFDSYSGAKLVQRSGKLVSPEEHSYSWDSVWDDFFDFDNFRFKWPYENHDRNKMLHQDVYDWYDRANPYLERDEDVRITETASAYVEGKETLDPGGIFEAIDDMLEALRPI
mmetsp:Transcript_27543/g.69441  ORF Transcript_27543/g.69441 Transcript_27543/m.69441 type:complete len:283 (+) Transcript_27543:110-958(+)|eukprot:g17562.t1